MPARACWRSATTRWRSSGWCFVALLLFVGGRPDLRHEVETRTFAWLQQRHEARQPPEVALERELGEPGAIARATAIDPRDLPRQQAAVAQWLSRRYRVAPEPISRLVQEAWQVGTRTGLDPTLILAIMAVESSFNPFAQSSVGAQGLMQVMTKVHDEKYEVFGGAHAAFDPVTNLRVGVQVLKECIARAGSVEAGLRFYVGAANLPEDGGYATKVLNEQNHLKQVAGGRSVPYMTAIGLRYELGAGAGRTGSDAEAAGGRRRDSEGRRADPRGAARLPALSDAGAPRLRYTGDAARLAMRPRLRGPRWKTTGERGRCPRSWHRSSRSPGQPGRCVRSARMHPGSLQRTARCSTDPFPPLPASIPRSGRRSRPRTGARKSTSS